MRVYVVTILLLIPVVSFAQKIGTKKNITLRLTDYSCGDNCYIEFIDIKTGYTYDFHNTDRKTIEIGNVFGEIQDQYYEYGESSSFPLIGSHYDTLLEYKWTKDWEETPEGPVYLKRRIKKWIMKSIRRIK